MYDFFPPRIRGAEPNQDQWMREYNNTHRRQFNPVFFNRKDEHLVESMKKVILSCQRTKGYFSIEVTGFDIEYEYGKCRKILHEYYEKKKEGKTKKQEENPYDYINIKDSDFFLMIVHYHIAVKGTEIIPKSSMDFDVIIQLPRLVDKYYYRINGNLYIALYQIVDGSTYNNTISNINGSSKKKTVTSKTLFNPIKMYRNVHPMKTSIGETKKIVHYTTRLFSKTFSMFKFYFAAGGVMNTIGFFGLGEDWNISFADLTSETMYCFPSKSGININVPRYIFDRDLVTQSMVYALWKQFNIAPLFDPDSSTEKEYLDYILSTEYWLEALAEEFTSKLYKEKGEAVLISFEQQLDLITQSDLHLKNEDKETIYHYIRWYVREFPELRKKDITDISFKKIRLTDYIASMYTNKFIKGVFLASDAQSSIKLEDIKSYVYTEPDFLLSRMVNDKLVTYKNSVNDMDAINALKFSYKGVSGLGDQKNSTIPKQFRYVHPSHLGRVDVDSSSASDPGLRGELCPYGTLYGNSFCDYEEPDTWRAMYAELIEKYREYKSKSELSKLQETLPNLLNEDDIDEANENLNMTYEAMQLYQDAENNSSEIEFDPEFGDLCDDTDSDSDDDDFDDFSND